MGTRHNAALTVELLQKLQLIAAKGAATLPHNCWTDASVVNERSDSMLSYRCTRRFFVTQEAMSTAFSLQKYFHTYDLQFLMPSKQSPGNLTWCSKLLIIHYTNGYSSTRLETNEYTNEQIFGIFSLALVRIPQIHGLNFGSINNVGRTLLGLPWKQNGCPMGYITLLSVISPLKRGVQCLWRLTVSTVY